MSFSIHTGFHDLPHSSAVEKYVKERALELAALHKGVESCKVTVERPGHGRRGNPYQIHVVLGLKGRTVPVTAPDSSASHEDVYLAIDDAFDKAERRLKSLFQGRRKQAVHHGLDAFPER